MSKFIVDVTQLIHWQGRLTGIPRVMQELALRFSTLGDRDVVYVSWVKELRDMCEVDLAATLLIRGRGIEYTKEHATAKDDEKITPPTITYSEVESTRLSLMRKSKNLSKKVIRKIGAENLAPVVRLRENLYQKNLQSYRRATPNRGDIFFIAGGEWWDNNFIELVERYSRMGVDIVQVSHDMLPIVTPQFAGHATDSLANYNARILPISKLVLTVSESTKRDVISWLHHKGLHIPPIRVFRLGEDFAVAEPKKPTEVQFMNAHLNGHDFILCVGTIEARKNHILLYYAYKLARDRGITLPKLIVVGRLGWKTENIYDYITQDPQTKDDILMLHDTSDEELSWLYSHCLFTIYPSLYEGWGMPIAESIGRGTPCLASNTSSMVEVAPGFADYFTPTSTDELLNGIMKLLEPGALERKKEHIKSYQSTSWDDSFKQVMTYLESI